MKMGDVSATPLAIKLIVTSISLKDQTLHIKRQKTAKNCKLGLHAGPIARQAIVAGTWGEHGGMQTMSTCGMVNRSK